MCLWRNMGGLTPFICGGLEDAVIPSCGRNPESVIDSEPLNSKQAAVLQGGA